MGCQRLTIYLIHFQYQNLNMMEQIANNRRIVGSLTQTYHWTSKLSHKWWITNGWRSTWHRFTICGYLLAPLHQGGFKANLLYISKALQSSCHKILLQYLKLVELMLGYKVTSYLSQSHYFTAKRDCTSNAQSKGC